MTLFDESLDLAVRFFVPGKVVGKQRARGRMRGQYVQMYTPKETENYEATVRMAASSAMAGREMLTGTVDAVLHVQVVPPASWSRRKTTEALAGLIHPGTKPDVDNVAKAIFDGMNGIVWRDDVLVVTALVRKRYERVPGVLVTVLPGGTLGTPAGYPLTTSVILP